MLTMKAKYALKALVALARSESGQMQVKAIAAEANIPYKFLEAILGELKNRGLVNSRRGTGGGYWLARDAKKIMAADVIRIVDGPLAPIRCASITAYRACDDCPNESRCSLHDLMQDTREALSSILDKRSIYSMAFFEKRKSRKASRA